MRMGNIIGGSNSGARQNAAAIPKGSGSRAVRLCGQTGSSAPGVHLTRLALCALSLLCSNYGALGVKRTLTRYDDLVGLSITRISADDMLRKHWHVVRSPRLLVVYAAMNGPEFAERLANHHPDQNNISFPERGDFLSAERIHAGTVSFSLRKSARAISA
jgi:hypothetical protein